MAKKQDGKFDQDAITAFVKSIANDTIRTTAMVRSPERSIDEMTRRILASRTAPKYAKKAALKAAEKMARRNASAMTRSASK